MITLHQATDEIKSMLKWAGIIIGSLIVIIFAFKLILGIKELFFPTPPALPPQKLEAIHFPVSFGSTSYSYTINTQDGKLPDFPSRVLVFKIQGQAPNLLAFRKAKDILALVGFTGAESQLSEATYQWTDSSAPIRKIVYNTVSQNFQLTSQYSTDPTVLSAVNLPDQNQATQVAQSFFDNLSSFPADIDKSKTQVSIFDIQNGQLVPASSFSRAKIVWIDFFQKNINEIPVVYPYPPHSPINALVSASVRQINGQVVEANFLYHSVDTATASAALYPIISSTQAFEQLKQQKGYIAHQSLSQNVQITKVSLGYYLGEEDQRFAMPVIVFEGLDNFIAYVSAVSPEWIK